MEHEEIQIEKVLSSKGEKNPHIVQWHDGQYPTFEKFFDPFPEFPQITTWDYDRELKCMKGQDNLWPLVRLVENEEWFQADQCLHWNFLAGRTMKQADKDYRKLYNKKAKAEVRSTSPECDDEEEVDENKDELKDKEKPKFPTVGTWSNDDLIRYLTFCKVKKSLITKCKDNKLTGKEACDVDYGDQMNTAMVKAVMDYGFEKDE
eukprot:UN24428